MTRHRQTRSNPSGSSRLSQISAPVSRFQIRPQLPFSPFKTRILLIFGLCAFVTVAALGLFPRIPAAADHATQALLAQHTQDTARDIGRTVIGMRRAMETLASDPDARRAFDALAQSERAQITAPLPSIVQSTKIIQQKYRRTLLSDSAYRTIAVLRADTTWLHTDTLAPNESSRTVMPPVASLDEIAAQHSISGISEFPNGYFTTFESPANTPQQIAFVMPVRTAENALYGAAILISDITPAPPLNDPQLAQFNAPQIHMPSAGLLRQLSTDISPTNPVIAKEVTGSDGLLAYSATPFAATNGAPDLRLTITQKRPNVPYAAVGSLGYNGAPWRFLAVLVVGIACYFFIKSTAPLRHLHKALLKALTTIGARRRRPEKTDADQYLLTDINALEDASLPSSPQTLLEVSAEASPLIDASEMIERGSPAASGMLGYSTNTPIPPTEFDTQQADNSPRPCETSTAPPAHEPAPPRQGFSEYDQWLDDLIAPPRADLAPVARTLVSGEALFEEVRDLTHVPEGFTLGCAPALLAESFDRMPLVQILANTVNDSINHHDSGGERRVYIDFSDHGNQWEFSISDDGPGIAPRYHKQVFERPQTLRSRDETDTRGTGMWSVQKQIQDAGGTIELISDGTRGCTFKIGWPKHLLKGALS